MLRVFDCAGEKVRAEFPRPGALYLKERVLINLTTLAINSVPPRWLRLNGESLFGYPLGFDLRLLQEIKRVHVPFAHIHRTSFLVLP